MKIKIFKKKKTNENDKFKKQQQKKRDDLFNFITEIIDTAYINTFK